jgi:hypothetical protein
VTSHRGNNNTNAAHAKVTAAGVLTLGHHPESCKSAQ